MIIEQLSCFWAPIKCLICSIDCYNQIFLSPSKPSHFLLPSLLIYGLQYGEPFSPNRKTFQKKAHNNKTNNTTYNAINIKKNQYHSLKTAYLLKLIILNLLLKNFVNDQFALKFEISIICLLGCMHIFCLFILFMINFCIVCIFIFRFQSDFKN